MDLSKIKSAVVNQLTNTNGLYSLKIQNHIYGCFILMEDIAQKTVTTTETIISTKTFIFDFDKRFNEIGIRYGFAMDTKLILDTYNSEYKECWIQCFKDIATSTDINEVDKIEDCLIEIIQTNVKADDAFFLNALESGSLSQEWIEKILLLLNPQSEAQNNDDEVIVKSAISNAISEKPIKRLSTTRRAHKIIKKKALAKTRRHK
jgi:hypothetical protein